MQVSTVFTPLPLFVLLNICNCNVLRYLKLVIGDLLIHLTHVTITWHRGLYLNKAVSSDLSPESSRRNFGLKRWDENKSAPSMFFYFPPSWFKCNIGYNSARISLVPLWSYPGPDSDASHGSQGCAWPWVCDVIRSWDHRRLSQGDCGRHHSRRSFLVSVRNPDRAKGKIENIAPRWLRRREPLEDTWTSPLFLQSFGSDYLPASGAHTRSLSFPHCFNFQGIVCTTEQPDATRRPSKWLWLKIDYWKDWF